VKNTLLVLALLALLATNATRIIHATDLWHSHKLNKALVAITCDQDTNPAIIEAATDNAVLVSCDKVNEAEAKN